MNVVYTKRGYPFTTGHRRYQFISRPSASVHEVQGNNMPLESYTARWLPMVGFSAFSNSGCARERQPRNAMPIRRRMSCVSEMQPQAKLHAPLIHGRGKHLAYGGIAYARVRCREIRMIEC